LLWLVLGGVVLFLLVGGLRAFERAEIGTIKALLTWIAAIGGMLLALLLILTGRGGTAIFALSLLGPMLWNRLRPSGPTATASGGQARQSAASMSREEAYEVLGLAPGASDSDIQAAYVRLMRAAHPDTGGSDWLAARVNMARDVLLGRRR
jgi:hypothetical protein